MEVTGVFSPEGTFRERRRFEDWAHRWIRLPGSDEQPDEHLHPEEDWRRCLKEIPDPADWLAALSKVTGVYFFPSREWPQRLVRLLKLLKVNRLLEAGAGRGYLSIALAFRCRAAGLIFKAVDKGEGEFVSGLPVSPVVEKGDVFEVVWAFRPQAILYAWPPPGQSLGSLLHVPSVKYLIVVGEAGGGVTGSPEDWLRLNHKKSPFLTRFGRGRTGERQHQVTIFYR